MLFLQDQLLFPQLPKRLINPAQQSINSDDLPTFLFPQQQYVDD
jgi:hypothetical protein